MAQERDQTRAAVLVMYLQYCYIGHESVHNQLDSFSSSRKRCTSFSLRKGLSPRLEIDQYTSLYSKLGWTRQLTFHPGSQFGMSLS